MRLAIWLAFAASLIAAPASATWQRQLPEEPTELKCDQGPLEVSVGGADWLAYGCDDAFTLVIVSAKDNPASPFYFIFARHPSGGHRLYGEGNGDKAFTKPAFHELKTWSESKIEATRLEAVAATSANQKSVRPESVEGHSPCAQCFDKLGTNGVIAFPGQKPRSAGGKG